MKKERINKRTENSTFQFHDYAFAILILLPLIFNSCASTTMNPSDLYSEDSLSRTGSHDGNAGWDPYLCNPDSVEATTWFWEHSPGKDTVWIDRVKDEATDPFLFDPESVEATRFWERPRKNDVVSIEIQTDVLPFDFLYFQRQSVEESIPRD